MTNPRPAVFEMRLSVTPDHIDEMGHVNNVVYLQWVQDVAAGHWNRAATPEQRAEIVWVAVRHEIEYKAPAFAGEEIVARTWVEGWSAVTSERHTEIVRPEDDRLLVAAKTVWCAIDPASKRPKRVGAQVMERFLSP